MISQETPESFRSAHQNGKETVTMTRLRDFLFMAPVDILANPAFAGQVRSGQEVVLLSKYSSFSCQVCG